jgi:hypothetical protein
MKNDTMEFTMKEVFLALKPEDDMSGPLNCREPGMCNARWINDASLISRFITSGWSVFRVNGFQRITEVTVELKMEKEDDHTESNQPAKPDNKRGR